MMYYLGDTLSGTYAGFSATNLSAYFGISYAAADALINLANGVPLSDAQQAAIRAINPNRFAPGASGPNQGYGDITWGLAHLAQHPLGSHYHSGIGNIFSTIGLNLATGGLYTIGKSAVGVAKGGSITEAAKTGLAVYGPAGSVLQPAIGTEKTLAVEAAAAAAALTAGGGSSLISGALSKAPSFMTRFGGRAPQGSVATGFDESAYTEPPPEPVTTPGAMFGPPAPPPGYSPLPHPPQTDYTWLMVGGAAVLAALFLLRR
jgi:hypothetical protein